MPHAAARAVLVPHHQDSIATAEPLAVDQTRLACSCVRRRQEPPARPASSVAARRSISAAHLLRPAADIRPPSRSAVPCTPSASQQRPGAVPAQSRGTTSRETSPPPTEHPPAAARTPPSLCDASPSLPRVVCAAESAPLAALAVLGAQSRATANWASSIAVAAAPPSASEPAQSLSAPDLRPLLPPLASAHSSRPPPPPAASALAGHERPVTPCGGARTRRSSWPWSQPSLLRCRQSAGPGSA
eukprot:4367046-Prymnesium_polylepis.3